MQGRFHHFYVLRSVGLTSNHLLPLCVLMMNHNAKLVIIIQTTK